MKTAVKRFAIVAFILGSWLPIYAQTQQADVFVRSAPIMRIYTHALGYKVVYRKSDLALGEFYVPKTWFLHSGGKAELVWGNRQACPYFSMFWVDGRFGYIRLYVLSDLSSDTWGVLTGGTELRDSFDIDDLQIDF